MPPRWAQWSVDCTRLAPPLPTPALPPPLHLLPLPPHPCILAPSHPGHLPVVVSRAPFSGGPGQRDGQPAATRVELVVLLRAVRHRHLHGAAGHGHHQRHGHQRHAGRRLRARQPPPCSGRAHSQRRPPLPCCCLRVRRAKQLRIPRLQQPRVRKPAACCIMNRAAPAPHRVGGRAPAGTSLSTTASLCAGTGRWPCPVLCARSVWPFCMPVLCLPPFHPSSIHSLSRPSRHSACPPARRRRLDGAAEPLRRHEEARTRPRLATRGALLTGGLPNAVTCLPWPRPAVRHATHPHTVQYDGRGVPRPRAVSKRLQAARRPRARARVQVWDIHIGQHWPPRDRHPSPSPSPPPPPPPPPAHRTISHFPFPIPGLSTPRLLGNLFSSSRISPAQTVSYPRQWRMLVKLSLRFLPVSMCGTNHRPRRRATRRATPRRQTVAACATSGHSGTGRGPFNFTAMGADSISPAHLHARPMGHGAHV